MSDYSHRDRVMRAWFEGRTWDENPEFKLKQQLVQASLPELAAFPLLIDDEWEVTTGATNEGRGDLLFTDGLGNFAVVEVKWMPQTLGGRTARTARNRKRKAVRTQAWTYAAAVLRRFPEAKTATAFVFTDDWQQRGMERIGVLNQGTYASVEAEPASFEFLDEDLDEP